MIQIENLHKSFGIPGTSSERKVLEGLSLTVRRGEKIAITGPSGSGKTTLLNLMAALDQPDSGRIQFNNVDIGTLGERALDDFRRRTIGLIFQLHHLLPQCTLIENVLVPILATARKVSKDQLSRAEEIISRIGLWEVRNQKPAELSGGECQRAAVARALINNPDVLLADEPTGALDLNNARNLTTLLTAINRDFGLTIVLVTHSAELAGKMDRSLSLNNGRLES